ncbi:hypothetical protein DYU11_14220 [Fibrisoma montanum]|uniref:SprT-like domain-containing protein n=2 Tax=Fibrisoma montanum TaxID=2305895 RepID=A0A418M9B4_9BACT|nr:hypothetical protein DYU11_14220 [Fibrisoma montanum]
MQITVNADLSPFACLITYVHEVAHADVETSGRLQRRRRRVAPHGIEWQTAFQRLMQPLLTEAVFPFHILKPLQDYMQKPAATTYAHPELMMALRKADRQIAEPIVTDRRLLRDVPEGQAFVLNKKTFVRGTMRRTRVVCKEVPSGKSYAILAHAWVETK